MKSFFICISILSIFFSSTTRAQSIVAISSGISTDLNNKKPFYMVPITLRWEPFKRSALFIEATQGIGFNRLSNGNAYTASAVLPDHVVLTEAIKLTSFSVDIGASIVVYTNKKNNRFTINLAPGICTEKFGVNYRNYDKANYEVLNPDVSERRQGLYASIAGLYQFHKRKQDMFIMLRLQSNSSARDPDRYKLSYSTTAPLQLTYGYNFFYNKKTK